MKFILSISCIILLTSSGFSQINAEIANAFADGFTPEEIENIMLNAPFKQHEKWMKKNGYKYDRDKSTNTYLFYSKNDVVRFILFFYKNDINEVAVISSPQKFYQAIRTMEKDKSYRLVKETVDDIGNGKFMKSGTWIKNEVVFDATTDDHSIRVYKDFDGLRFKPTIRSFEDQTSDQPVSSKSNATAKDWEGRIYNTRSIQNRVWMTENLNTIRFRNGDLIPEAKTEAEWKKAGELGQPAWCHYENNPDNSKKYGRIYNGFAVFDARGLAPEGYRIPTFEEWNTIGITNDGNGGGKLKATSGWNSPNTGATNAEGFSALPAGTRNAEGKFYDLGKQTSWWSAAVFDLNVRVLSLIYDSKSFYNGVQSKSFGNSVRCIKD